MKIVNYNKFADKYLELMEQFSNYIITYKLDKLNKFPSSANIVIFDDKDEAFSNYSLRILTVLLRKKTPNVYEVRKTGLRTMPWKIAQPINITTL